MDEKRQRNEYYLKQIYSALKQTENLVLSKTRTTFNNSEMRLISEIIYANCNGERLISTQLAQKLGITRSAVSQMVNKLEKENVIKRVPDDVDRKIAYIELSENAIVVYDKEVETCLNFVDELINKIGEKKLQQFLSLCQLFTTAVSDLKR